MTRFLPSPHRAARALPLVALALCAAAPAQAQFGALRRAVERKAGEAVEQKAEDKAGVAMLQQPTFDATTVELTDALLDKYVAGLAQVQAQRAASRAEYDRLYAIEQAQQDSAQRLWSANRADGQRYEEAKGRYDDCANRYESEREELVSAAMDKLSARLERQLTGNPMAAANDPNIRRLSEQMQRYTTAVSTGDTIVMKKAVAELLAGQGVLTPAEKAKVDRTLASVCGPAVKEPAWMVAQQALNARAQATRAARINLAQGAGRPTGAALGVSETQAAMVHERIQSWRNGMNPNAPLTVRFSREEYRRLLARRAAIEKASEG